MNRPTYKHKPSDLLERLRQTSLAFLSPQARQKIDELMELVCTDQAAHERSRDAGLRWFVLTEGEQTAAHHRLTVCLAVYSLMQDGGLALPQAINSLLERGEQSRRASGLRTDQHQALRDLGLRPGFLGMRAVQVWVEKIDGLPHGNEQLLALVPAQVLEASNSRYLDALAQAHALEARHG